MKLMMSSGGVGGRSVEHVADQRMTDSSEVHADLVSPGTVRAHIDPRLVASVETSEHFGSRRLRPEPLGFARVGARANPSTVARITRDRMIDHERGRHVPHTPGAVELVNRTCSKLRAQRVERFDVACREEKTGGSRIEPMNDPRLAR